MAGPVCTMAAADGLPIGYKHGGSAYGPLKRERKHDETDEVITVKVY